jgi:hypothetical protein
MLIVDLCTAWVGNIVFAFIYNKIYTKSLMRDKNFSPADEHSKNQLAAAGFLN